MASDCCDDPFDRRQLVLPPVASFRIDAALAELGIPVMQTRTTQRVAYPTAITEGNSVVGGPDQTARNEILAIRGELEFDP